MVYYQVFIFSLNPFFVPFTIQVHSDEITVKKWRWLTVSRSLTGLILFSIKWKTWKVKVLLMFYLEPQWSPQWLYSKQRLGFLCKQYPVCNHRVCFLDVLPGFTYPALSSPDCKVHCTVLALIHDSSVQLFVHAGRRWVGIPVNSGIQNTSYVTV